MATDKALVQSTSPTPSFSMFADFYAEPETNSYIETPQYKPSHNLEDDDQVNLSYISDVTGPSDNDSIDSDSLIPPKPPRNLQTTRVIDPPSVIRYRQKRLEILMSNPEFVEKFKDKHDIIEKKVIGGKKGEMEMVLVYKKSQKRVPDTIIDRQYIKYFSI